MVTKAPVTVSRRDAECVALLDRDAVHLAPPDAREFADPFRRFGNARLVLLGEATHGTSEFYRARAAITRLLIENHGFNIVAAEADWPDAARIDQFVRGREPAMSEEKAFARFPSWMWRNNEFREFVDWLRAFNDKRPPRARVEFRGLDVYSLRASIAAVLAYLDKVDPNAASIARERYGCLTPWQSDPAEYGSAVLSGYRSCEDKAVAQLNSLLEKRLNYIARDGEAFFDAAQNARVVRAAELYYRRMYYDSAESWNLRDRHMFETLQFIMQARGSDARAVVWAHNSHIGNAAATAMGWEGEFNIGELCRTAYGDDVALIGFGTDHGTVAAARRWDEPVQIMTVVPARADSYEGLFHRVEAKRSLTVWREPRQRDLRDALAEPRLERAIGVVYRPESELGSHYFKAVLPDQFDAYVWFDETSAVTPFGPLRGEELPEGYPFGV